ncbi:uncharacterized protein DUF664 [Rudaeicoccus suwonensis]|uniref:Uncharacterized protein DUF664 n=2 Tax=Rudaeicoccus suwonensis TaxID=657409 RepID=A0A561EBJ7_9MICO|nr:uncharacterized protein DUF664 [Rudaeicoccus suwonensis]
MTTAPAVGRFAGMTTATFAPDDRRDPALRAGEAETLLGFLNYHRDTLRMKIGGLTAEQLATTLAPSDMTLGGMLKHLALVEDNWLVVVFAGQPDPEPWASAGDDDPDWEWHSAHLDSPTELRELYDASVARADTVISAALAGGGLAAESQRPSRHTGERFSLRWILLHLVEEYARHNGHADLIRQSIDGQVGE